MKVKKIRPTPKGTKVTKEFLFDLTVTEFAEKGKEAAAFSKDVSTLETQFDQVKKEWQAKIKTHESKRDELLAVINSKKEKRVVEAILVKNYETKEVEYWFEGEVLERRTMTSDELQTEMPLEKKTRKYTRKHHHDPVAEANDSDVGQVIREETSRSTKHSAVDGVVQ